MSDDFFSSLAEFGARIGLRLMGKPTEPGREISKPDLANAMLDSSIIQAARIAKRLEINQELEQRDFVFIVGVILAEQAALVEYLTTTKVSALTECSRDIKAALDQALIELRR
jgi:hypothetical protein